MSDEDYDDDEEDGDNLDGLDALLKAMGTPSKPTEPECQALSSGDEAKGFLQMLIDQEHLELEPGADLDALAAGTTAFICANGNAEWRTKALIAWLLAADGVYDLFCDDEVIMSLLAEW